MQAGKYVRSCRRGMEGEREGGREERGRERESGRESGRERERRVGGRERREGRGDNKISGGGKTVKEREMRGWKRGSEGRLEEERRREGRRGEDN